MTFLLALKDSFLDFLFPQNKELRALENLSGEAMLSLLPRSTLDQRDSFALFSYQDPLVKACVWELKYCGNKEITRKVARALYHTIIAELDERKISQALLIPMPVSDKRRLERGFNQTELLTEALKDLDTPNRFHYLPHILIKVRHTESQTHTVSKLERLENLHDSMAVSNSETISGKVIVLIDDVTTTGATFAEAKRALRFAHARLVLCFALAH